MGRALRSTPLETICTRCGKQLGEHVVQTDPPVHYQGQPGERVELLGIDFCSSSGPDRFNSIDHDEEREDLLKRAGGR